MARYSIWLRDRRSQYLQPMKINMTISEATTYVTKQRNLLNPNQELVTENQSTGEADMFFTKMSTITPNKPMWIKGNTLTDKKLSKPKRSVRKWGQARPVSIKSNSSKGKYDRMWRMKSKQIYAWLRNPKNGTKKDRRMASYILSTRRRK